LDFAAMQVVEPREPHLLLFPADGRRGGGELWLLVERSIGERGDGRVEARRRWILGDPEWICRAAAEQCT
jgi:hypothetical protein